jgi:hypothetical protein
MRGSRRLSAGAEPVSSYRIEFGGPALVQLIGLPPEAFDALAERAAELTDEPWDAVMMAPGHDPALRETPFGHGAGFISFRFDETAGLVRIFNIVWTG